MATHSSILAWKIPWTKEPGWLQSMGLQRAQIRLSTQECMCVCVCVCVLFIIFMNKLPKYKLSELNPFISVTAYYFKTLNKCQMNRGMYLPLILSYLLKCRTTLIKETIRICQYSSRQPIFLFMKE